MCYEQKFGVSLCKDNFVYIYIYKAGQIGTELLFTWMAKVGLFLDIGSTHKSILSSLLSPPKIFLECDIVYLSYAQIHIRTFT